MLSLILPTYNEAKNLPELLPKLEAVLESIPFEIIVVDDDSPDRTWEVGLEFAARRPHLHIVRRVGRSGLASAVIEGWLAAKGDVLAVMDADGQHDMAILPQLYSALSHKEQEIAIGSRYIDGGSVGEWDEQRYRLSRMATRLALRLCAVSVKDPMSGFFALRRETFQEVLPRLNPKGFKILLDVLVHVPSSTRAVEIPFTFQDRLHGESKLSPRVQLEFLEYLYDVSVGRFIPLTFLKYCIVGALGVLVHVSLYLFFSYLLQSNGYVLNVREFSIAVLGAIEGAIFFNFLLNNYWTFARQKLHGVAAVRGFFIFNFACGFGALANYAVSTFLFVRGTPELLAVVLGAFTGVIWNYTMNRMFTWRG